MLKVRMMLCLIRCIKITGMNKEFEVQVKDPSTNGKAQSEEESRKRKGPHKRWGHLYRNTTYPSRCRNRAHSCAQTILFPGHLSCSGGGKVRVT